MDAATPSKRARTTVAATASIAGTPHKLQKAASFATPEKPPQKAPADLTWTPDKTEERPLLRRAAGKGAVALSVKEVRRAALGLRRPDKGPVPAEVAKEDALESDARELGVGAAAGRSPVKRRPEVKLPESYEMICEFFNCFESSTRLLPMKGSKVTFPNICASIQNLADRQFTYGNLAQLKYIMPEAIVINKILLRDEKTCCMKPDLQVNLLVDAVEGSVMHKGETRYSALRRMFRQRVVDFFRNHPKGHDIPEHELPHPFTQTKPSVAQITPRVVTEAESATPSPSLAEQQPVGMSHLSHSFKRRFSQRSSTCPATAGTTSLLANAESCTTASPLSRKSVLSSFSGGIDHESQVQEKGDKDVALRFGASEGTPAKFASTPVRLMASTPGLHTPKRSMSATMCETPPLTMAKRSARAKLFMTPTKDATSMEEENQSTSTCAVDADDELLSFLPKSLLQSKEKRALEEKETGFADQVQRQKLISSLPSTFDIIFLIYQSRQRSVLNKQELVDNIIDHNPKIVDKAEIEEQLRLLQEFVPHLASENANDNFHQILYEMLCEFFNCFESSNRLLRMKGSKATFPNICASIQNLADRRFTYGNLAQLKYIMPEAIVINKILLRDEKTCCMKPDLQVNLLVDAVEGSVMHKGETRYSALRRMFRQRVVDFFRNHPQGDDIPEHELPHPFTQTKPSVAHIAPRFVPEAVPSPSLAEQRPVAMSHMPHSFKRMFSQRSSTSPATASTTSPLANTETSPASPLSRKSVPSSVSGGINHESQVQEKGGKDVALRFGASEGTPAKFASTPVRLMSGTPDLHTPKRPMSATLCETPPLTMAKRSARAKLFMTPTKDASSMEEENQNTSTSAIDADDELLSFLPKSLLQSVKQEERALEEKETGYADQVQRQKLISSLPSTFDIIFLIYQSRQRSVLNKQELVDNIIDHSPKIVDKAEIEEQLRLLQEFVPEWISEKTALSGDVLCCVDTSLSQ